MNFSIKKNKSHLLRGAGDVRLQREDAQPPLQHPAALPLVLSFPSCASLSASWTDAWPDGNGSQDCAKVKKVSRNRVK